MFDSQQKKNTSQMQSKPSREDFVCHTVIFLSSQLQCAGCGEGSVRQGWEYFDKGGCGVGSEEESWQRKLRNDSGLYRQQEAFTCLQEWMDLSGKMSPRTRMDGWHMRTLLPGQEKQLSAEVTVGSGLSGSNLATLLWASHSTCLDFCFWIIGRLCME